MKRIHKGIASVPAAPLCFILLSGGVPFFAGTEAGFSCRAADVWNVPIGTLLLFAPPHGTIEPTGLYIPRLYGARRAYVQRGGAVRHR